MVLLIVKILGSWCLLSTIGAYTWSRCMAAGRCLNVNDMIVVVSPRGEAERMEGMDPLRAHSR